jgi:hypothetical protein
MNDDVRDGVGGGGVGGTGMGSDIDCLLLFLHNFFITLTLNMVVRLEDAASSPFAESVENLLVVLVPSVPAREGAKMSEGSVDTMDDLDSQ